MNYEVKTGYGTGWSALWGGAIGGVVGYLVGRNSNNGCGGGWNNGCAGVHSSCQTCFEQGEYTGENRAGINYIAQKVTGLAQDLAAVNANVNQRFEQLNQQKIADLMAENAALRTQSVVFNSACQTNNQLSLINHTLNSITTGCGVKSYPGCPNSCTACGAA